MFCLLRFGSRGICYSRQNSIYLHCYEFPKENKIKKDDFCKFCKGNGFLYDEETKTSNECFICGGSGLTHQIF